MSDPRLKHIRGQYEGATGRDPDGPDFEELLRRRTAEENRRFRAGLQGNNFDRRFGSPVFSPPVFKKRSLIYNYPRTATVVLVGLSFGILYARPIYDIFFRELAPLTEEQKRKEKEFKKAFWFLVRNFNALHRYKC